ncbi:hypothetical protein PsorP6_007840 [Peronosclerospora sorghi]|uniref:Uncharacterized protein n=1 Tax=Peronosclerospora sorghi TaxID=230839 RepID=A0ACC0W7W2_9STRA|nr:hypothetical protein PsorP6_007840 [Peronosclerospora sorghi]
MKTQFLVLIASTWCPATPVRAAVEATDAAALDLDHSTRVDRNETRNLRKKKEDLTDVSDEERMIPDLLSQLASHPLRAEFDIARIEENPAQKEFKMDINSIGQSLHQVRQHSISSNKNADDRITMALGYEYFKRLEATEATAKMFSLAPLDNLHSDEEVRLKQFLAEHGISSGRAIWRYRWLVKQAKTKLNSRTIHLMILGGEVLDSNPLVQASHARCLEPCHVKVLLDEIPHGNGDEGDEELLKKAVDKAMGEYLTLKKRRDDLD